ncbi:lipase family protein [Microbacterium sp. NPDC057659]|uniref:lipase family protein n=1 Tax=Microbacterium sp. NPDC057659 TaxID=3346198 RepID=UPI00366EB8BF
MTPEAADRAGIVTRARRAATGWLAHVPWPVSVVVSVAAIALGVVLVIRPTTSLGVLAILIGAGLVVAGVLEFVLPGIRRPSLRMLLAIALAIAGVVVLILPGLTVRGLALVVGIAMIARGAIGIVQALVERDLTIDRRVSEVLLGAAAVALGVLALVWPDITLLVVAVVFGATLVLIGAGTLIALWRKHRAAAFGETARGEPASDDSASDEPRGDTVARRWMRTIGAVCAVALAAGALVASVTLREGSPVVDEFYAAPRTVPSEPGKLIRAEAFTRGIPDGAVAWRILYTTTHGDGSAAVASGIVVAPDDSEAHPVIAWHHGTTGFDESCAPSLATDPFGSGAMFVLPDVIARGWTMVATDYIGLGTQGPHPYLIGKDSARAELDAVRAARDLDGTRLTKQTVAWGHSQGGGAALWTGAVDADYAPDVPLDGVVALAPASDLSALVAHLPDVAGGSVFASFVMSGYSGVYPDVTFGEYIRPGAEVTVREMSRRCLAAPDMLVSVLSLLALSDDPEIFRKDPATGPLGTRLKQNLPPSQSAVPVLLGQGIDDDLVDYDMQSRYAAGLCRAGTYIDFRGYAGRDHISLVAAGSPAMDDVFAWTTDRFDGKETTAACAAG